MLRRILNRIKRKLYYHIANIFYLVNPSFFKCDLNIMDDDILIEKIIKDGNSISRFGDGEIGLIANKVDIGFQKHNELLSKKLLDVINCNGDRLIVCLPRAFIDLSDLKKKPKKYWIYYIFINKKNIENIFKKNYVYGNASITRFYIDYNNINNIEHKINQLRKIWNDKKILIVEGECTKLGVNNDLFDNSKLIRRIIVPRRNAFEYYQEILNSVIKNSKTFDIVLLSIGPTATVLSKDLSENGIQTIDIGHIDIEYEWYLMNAKEKVAIPGKDVNEVKLNSSSEELSNIDEYNNQIIKYIKQS